MPFEGQIIFAYSLCIQQTILSKASYIASKVCILSVHAFPRNQTSELGIASAMRYCMSHRIADLQITLKNTKKHENKSTFKQFMYCNGTCSTKTKLPEHKMVIILRNLVLKFVFSEYRKPT